MKERLNYYENNIIVFCEREKTVLENEKKKRKYYFFSYEKRERYGEEVNRIQNIPLQEAPQSSLKCSYF